MAIELIRNKHKIKELHRIELKLGETNEDKDRLKCIEEKIKKMSCRLVK